MHPTNEVKSRPWLLTNMCVQACRELAHSPVNDNLYVNCLYSATLTSLTHCKTRSIKFKDWKKTLKPSRKYSFAHTAPPTGTNYLFTFLLTRLQEALY